MSKNDDTAMEYNPFMAAQQTVSHLQDRFSALLTLTGDMNVSLNKDQRLSVLESMMSATASALPHIAESLNQGIRLLSQQEARMTSIHDDLMKLAKGVNGFVEEVNDHLGMKAPEPEPAKPNPEEGPVIQRIRKISRT